MTPLGPPCWLWRIDRGAPKHLAALSDIMNSPGVVLEDLLRVCEEASPELRSLRVLGARRGRSQVDFARVFLGPGRGTGRRHVGTDVPERGGASLRATFAENLFSEFQ